MDKPILMSGARVESLFIGGGCNRIVNSVSWGPSNLVAFAVSKAVGIFDPQEARILVTLPGHKDTVSCVEWIPQNKDAYKDSDSLEEQYLLSGSVDGMIKIWGYMTSDHKWREVMQVPKSHQKSVTCITSLMCSKSKALFASTASDGNVHIWQMLFPTQIAGELALSLVESISVGAKSMVSVSLAQLPGENETYVVAMGGLDNKVHLYVFERDKKFVHACELKGHQDWIRGLDFSLPYLSNEEKCILLASASQDRTIRIWKISLRNDKRKEENIANFSLQSFIEGPMFKTNGLVWQVSLESLLVGHEDWVHSVKWQPPVKVASQVRQDEWVQPRSILSASMDRTMMIWRPEKNTGIWVNEVTVGELSHTALGFYGGYWSPKGDAILSHGYGGSFHLWKNIGVLSEDWKPQLVPSGHSASVTDLAWDKSNQMILSTSQDQTTRIFAPWERNDEGKIRVSWREVARPQIHGHSINTVAVVKGQGNHQYVSGADEKVARVFEAPLSFLHTLEHTACSGMDRQIESEKVQILGANMSALGLSQKPIFVHGQAKISSGGKEDDADFMEKIPDAAPEVLKEPPLEEQLAQNTLWPETHKLYGHGNEVFAMCCDHRGKIVATACKAQTANAAEIWLWSVGSWRAVGRIPSHSLTVTQMEFSHDDLFLLSVSRDRHFSVIQIENKENEVAYEIIAKHDAHKRIIWSCSWNKCGYVFATGSRDKTVKVWKIEYNPKGENFVNELAVLPEFKSSVTAVSWAPQTNLIDSLLAVGLENGLIELWKMGLGRAVDDTGNMQFKQDFKSISFCSMLKFDPFLCHVATVHRLLWKESSSESNGTGSESSNLQFASCGEDNTVRLFNVILTA